MTAGGDQLREQAEKRVPKTPTNVSVLSTAENARLVYELEVHQEELEIQNEELRQAQLKLQASNDRYTDLYDFAPVGYLTINEVGAIVKANLMSATMLGRERSRIIGARLAVYCDLEFRKELANHIDRVLSTKLSQSCEVRFTAPNGKVLDTRLDTNFVANSTDACHCRMIMTDITSRKRAERELSEKESYLQSLADVVPMLICYVDRELRIQFSNIEFEKWFGLPPDELNGRLIQDVFGGESAHEIADYLADALTGHRVDFELQLEHQKRGRRYVQMMLVPCLGLDGAVQGIHGLCVDVTERKVVEDQNARRRNFADRLVRLNADVRDVYELLIQGKSNKSIANELDIGLRTVERRHQIAFEKLEVESLVELLQQLTETQGTNPIR